MQIPKRLIDCLTEKNVRYEILHHREAFTAQRIAESEYVKAEHHAKVVMVKTGEQHLMAVLPELELSSRSCCWISAARKGWNASSGTFCQTITGCRKSVRSSALR